MSYIVALDGPAGSGKSTIAKILAKKYGITYLDTGAMYRMVALYILENGLNYERKEDVLKTLSSIKLNIDGDKFYLNGKDVSEAIRTPEVTKLVSPVSTVKEIRERLVDIQREISKGKSVILDGRDIGTVVFPNADLKVFLVASAEVRAKRRVKDYAQKGIIQEFEDVLKDIKERDHRDSTRKESPLKKADDAIELDTSYLNIEQTTEKISELIDKIGG